MYINNGVRVIKNVLPEELISDLSLSLDKLYSNIKEDSITVGDIANKSPQKLSSLVKEDDYSKPFIVSSVLENEKRFLDLIKLDTLWEYAAKSLDCKVEDLLYHYCNITVKVPSFGPKISWHRDFPNRYISPKTSDFVRLLIPLEQMNSENGGLRFILNSHRILDEEVKDFYGAHDEESCNQQALYISSNIGDIVLLHPKTIHGSDMNTGKKSRPVFIIQFGKKNEEYLYKNEEFMSFKTKDEIKCL